MHVGYNFPENTAHLRNTLSLRTEYRGKIDVRVLLLSRDKKQYKERERVKRSAAAPIAHARDCPGPKSRSAARDAAL